MAVNRITGLTTGMDTDQLVKDLMKVERARYDKLYIKKTYAEWEQQAYRTTISTIDDFQSKYFDILNKDTYLMSRSSFGAFSSTTTIGGESKSYVTVEGTTEAKSMSHTISKVEQLATQDTWHSDVFGMATVTSGAISAQNITDLKNEGLSFNLTIDGYSKTIEVTDPELAAITNVDDLVAALNTEIEKQFGTGYSDVVTKVTEGGDELIRFDKPASHVAIFTETGSTSLNKLSITSGTSNQSYSSKSLEDLFGIGDAALTDFEINGIKVEGLSKDDTLDEFMDKVNDANTGAKIHFNELDKRFELISDKTGTVNNIDFSDSANANAFLTTMLGFADAAGDGSGGVAFREQGQNAIMELDGETIVKYENSFTIEGVKYTLNEAYDGADGAIDVNLTNNLDDVVDKIKDFVEDYNALIAGLNAIVTEPRNRDYDPLTEEQKDSLSEDQIEKWETEAKKGLLKREPTVVSMLDKMRSAFYEPVEDAGISLTEIGITTSDNYKDKGKLVIDEEALKSALESDFENVITLFTKESDNDYLEKGTASERYSENGLMARLDDIMSDVIRTTRDNDGNKGTLVEKAGVLEDSSVSDNSLTKILNDYDSRMDTMLDFLSKREERYYMEFSRMETALAQLQSQSASIVSSFGG